MNIQDILKEDNVTIVDVREPYEYSTNNVNTAVNMPLSKFGDFIDEIKALPGKVVFHCQSGGRSGQAVGYLEGLGMTNVYNGGSLMIMQSYAIPS